MSNRNSSFSKARAKALIKKEAKQMFRDKSTLTLGIILPMILLLLFGYGLSLDVKLVPMVIVNDNSSSLTRDLYNHLSFSPYFEPRLVYSYQEAEILMKNAETKAIVRRSTKESAEGLENIQIIVNGRDSNTAKITQIYLENAITQWAYKRLGTTSFIPSFQDIDVGQASVVGRIWYNSEQESKFFLIPGVTVLIMTLIGSMLTSLVIAREWERGTYEALIATPITKEEFILGKTIPYFLLGLCGLALCLLAAAFIFQVPMRGSIFLIILSSSIYLVISLGIGLLISAIVKSQFLASQIVLIVSFLPVVMLSGFIFDLNSAPTIAYYIAHIFPSTWFVSILQTLFLVGDVPKLLIKDLGIMIIYISFLFNILRIKVKKSLE